jgi:hypothetical protein
LTSAVRASPAFHATVSQFGQWRAALVMLTIAAMVILIAWFLAFVEPHSLWTTAGFALVLAGLSWNLSSFIRMRPVSLRWDGQCWHWGPAASGGHEPWVGHMEVCVDLGCWMLLRLMPESNARRMKKHWLAVQQRGLEAHWHALRCAVYSPRLEAGPRPDPLFLHE